MNLTITVHDDEGDEPRRLPARWEICDICQGSGTRDHPAFANGVDFSDDDDGEFREAYFAGRYDVPCECENGKVLVPDERRFAAADVETYRMHLDYRRNCTAQAAAQAAERRMGA